MRSPPPRLIVSVAPQRSERELRAMSRTDLHRIWAKPECGISLGAPPTSAPASVPAPTGAPWDDALGTAA